MALSDEDKQWMIETFAVRSEIDSKFAALEAKIDAKLEPLATREDVYNSETRLLTEFHKWASPMEKRYNGFMSLLTATSEEISLIKARLDKLEGRITS